MVDGPTSTRLNIFLNHLSTQYFEAGLAIQTVPEVIHSGGTSHHLLSMPQPTNVHHEQ
jgi:hypothetical protein